MRRMLEQTPPGLYRRLLPQVCGVQRSTAALNAAGYEVAYFSPRAVSQRR